MARTDESEKTVEAYLVRRMKEAGGRPINSFPPEMQECPTACVYFQGIGRNW